MVYHLAARSVSAKACIAIERVSEAHEELVARGLAVQVGCPPSCHTTVQQGAAGESSWRTEKTAKTKWNSS